MNKTSDIKVKINIKKAKLKVMCDLLRYLEGTINDVYYTYKPTGEKKPKTRRIRDENGDCIYINGEWQTEPVLDDDGNQVYDDVWDNVQKSEDELTDEDRYTIQACNELIDIIGKEGTK